MEITNIVEVQDFSPDTRVDASIQSPIRFRTLFFFYPRHSHAAATTLDRIDRIDRVQRRLLTEIGIDKRNA